MKLRVEMLNELPVALPIALPIELPIELSIELLIAIGCLVDAFWMSFSCLLATFWMPFRRVWTPLGGLLNPGTPIWAKKPRSIMFHDFR